VGVCPGSRAVVLDVAMDGKDAGCLALALALALALEVRHRVILRPLSITTIMIVSER
jgi:hypothetical protein